MNARSLSGTSQLLSWIPQTLSPQTTSLLLAELAKPISAHDEAGYIYIFWLTDADAAAPSASDAASLLSAPQASSRPSTGRRQSDVLRAFSSSGAAGTGATSPSKRTILLKIGRASNVHRRMAEWTRQCGYNLSLVRFYPYIPSLPPPPPSSPTSPASSPPHTPQRPPLLASSSSPPPASPGASVRKVPHAHRVERLVQLELADRRVRRECGVCGKEHREWFEVEASREGVRGVDEVVRRWVRWSESVGGGGE